MWRKPTEAKPSPPGMDLHTQPPVGSSLRSSVSDLLDRKPMVSSGADASTRLILGLVVKGEFSGQSDLFLDGEVEGKIRLAGSGVTVGPNGRVRGDIEAREIIIQGNVEGNLEGAERVLLSPSGKVKGDISCRRIVIEEGAFLRGRIEMEEAGESRGRATGSLKVVSEKAVSAPPDRSGRER